MFFLGPYKFSKFSFEKVNCNQLMALSTSRYFDVFSGDNSHLFGEVDKFFYFSSYWYVFYQFNVYLF